MTRVHRQLLQVLFNLNVFPKLLQIILVLQVFLCLRQRSGRRHYVSGMLCIRVCDPNKHC